mgnify:CR=1 FL=1
MTALAASLSGYFTDASVNTWYPLLAKPSWNPPASVFGPVWTVLYAMMTVAAWRVWKVAGWAGAKTALILFFVQLGLNAAWSGLFFRLHRPDLALAEILLLWCIIAMTLVAFRSHDRWAGALLAPYWVWVGYAATLNYAIWRLNS